MNFREFFTKTGKKAILGKSAEQNENLMKQYISKDNFVLHTEKPGSPFAIILELNPSKEDIKETAVFCALKSKDWRDNKKDVVMNIFSGKEVYKDKKMPTGTFGVKKCQKLLIKKEEILKLNKQVEKQEEKGSNFKEKDIKEKIKIIFNILKRKK